VSEPFTRANRLPKRGRITRSTRQQRNRLRLRPSRCYRCGGPIQPGQRVCFDDGHDAHAECSFTRNTELLKAARVLATQDADKLGTVRPCQMKALEPMQPMTQKRRPVPTGS
jgi:predicted nucleic acid-binding Zn ribbon protein